MSKSAKNRELEAIIIPEDQRQPELEEKVAYFMSITPNLPENKVKPQRTKPITSNDPYETSLWQREEIRRIRDGHFGMSGKFYFFYNYVWMWDIESGLIRPEYRFAQNEFFRHIEECQKSREWGAISVKRRRVGASWMVAADSLHDALTTPLFKAGMTSKTESDAKELFKKITFIYDNLPPFLQAEIFSKTVNSIEFAEKGPNKSKSGLRSEIVVKAPTDTSWEGHALRKLVVDESGKITNLKSIFSMAEPAMNSGTRRVGTPILFGTAGDIGKEGKDFMEMWYNAEVYKLKPFFFGGWMGLIVDEFGNDLKEHAIRWIVYERKRKESLSAKEYTDFIQQYPLTVQEAFKSNEEGGLGNRIKIEKQRNFLLSHPMPFKTGSFRPSSSHTPIFSPDHRGAAIIYEEPEPSFKGLYLAGCLPPGEKVMTDEGLMAIEQVSAKNQLINETGDLVPIREFLTYSVEDEDLYTLKMANTFRTTTFTKEHPILVSRHTRNNRVKGALNFDFKYETVDKVQLKDWIKVPNVYRKPNNFNIEDLWTDEGFRIDRQVSNPLLNPEFWWFVGFWLGDGWCGSNGYKISCSFNNAEPDHISRFKTLVESLFQRKVTIKHCQGCQEISFSFQQLSQFLIKHFGKYAHGKNIPEWVKRINIDCKKQLLLGYLDSDGCVTTNMGDKYSTEFVSVSLELLEAIQDILLSVGIVSSLTKLRDKQTHTFRDKPALTRITYHLRLAHHSSIQFREFINDTTSHKLRKINPLDKKTKNPQQGCLFLNDDLEYIYFQVKNVQHSKFTGTVYNFECETHTFMCHHITTHNCDPIDSYSENKSGSSLSMFIMSKPNGLQPPKIVFEMTERPVDPRDFYDQALLALMYYNNAKILIENNRYGMISYFEEKGFKHLLAGEPQGIKKYVPTVTQKPGYYKTKYTTAYLEEIIEEYIEDHADLVPSLKLLEELDNYGIQNTDRVDGWGAALMLLKDDKEKVRKTDEIKRHIPDFSYKYVNGRLQLVKNNSSGAKPFRPGMR